MSTILVETHRAESTRAPAARVAAYLEQWIAERPAPENLREALRYVLIAGGKGVRPTLAIHSFETVGGRGDDILAPAAAIEMVHNFSLVHDDLPAMDDDDLRRGRPTLHRVANEAMAILAGDMMLGLAFELIAVRSASPETAGALCRELARGTNDMIVGQVYDTLPEEGERIDLLEKLRRIHENKTAALIRTSCRLGAICGGASSEQLEALTRFGEAVGLMFQVVDDLLDVTQTTKHLGKTAEKDAAQKKLTYPGLLGVEGTREEVGRLRRLALESLAGLGPKAAPLRGLCEELAIRTR